MPVAKLLVLLLAAQLAAAAGASTPRQEHYASRQKDTWQHADDFCRGAGLGGLLQARGGLMGLTGKLRRGLCYWVHFSPISSRGGRCPCLRLMSGMMRNSLRLQQVNCRHRRRFLCLRGSPIDETEVHERSTSAPTANHARRTTKAAPTKTTTRRPHWSDQSEHGGGRGDTDAESVDGELPGDEAVDHVKFPVIGLGADGHVRGWLHPWGSVTTRAPAAAKVRASTSSSSGQQSTPPMIEEFEASRQKNASSSTGDTLKAMLSDQNSEFVTLLVLYTIVGVTLLVLLILCLVRCCRGYCGKSKSRYVKQVDADDIPRFMPSSWA